MKDTDKPSKGKRIGQIVAGIIFWCMWISMLLSTMKAREAANEARDSVRSLSNDLAKERAERLADKLSVQIENGNVQVSKTADGPILIFPNEGGLDCLLYHTDSCGRQIKCDCPGYNGNPTRK